MKKLLLFATIAIMLTGCKALGDKMYTREFQIVNQTNKSVSFAEKGRAERIVAPGQEMIVSEISGLGSPGKNLPKDIYEDEEIMNISHFPPIEIKIGEELMCEAILKRKYWTFTVTSSDATRYTLILSEELLEKIQGEESLSETK